MSINGESYLVFLLWKNLPYKKRLLVGFGLVALGFLLQLLLDLTLLGALPILAGNLLFLVQGYDNRVDFQAYEADAAWEAVTHEKLYEFRKLDQRIHDWDVSLLDASNAGGGLLFAALLALIVFLFFGGTDNPLGYAQAFAIDALLLLAPHWITGMRLIFTKPALIQKFQLIESILENPESLKDDVDADPMLLLKGAGINTPEDVKIRFNLKEHNKDFLGLYGQVVLNAVQGKNYPYFYVVLVAQKGYGLRKQHDSYQAPEGLIKEFKNQDGVEVLIIRQATSSTSGYHTDAPTIKRTFEAGMQLMRTVAR